MSIRNRAAKDAWDAEDEDFKTSFMAELDAEYNDALDIFLSRSGRQTPSSPEEYHK